MNIIRTAGDGFTRYACLSIDTGESDMIEAEADTRSYEEPKDLSRARVQRNLNNHSCSPAKLNGERYV